MQAEGVDDQEGQEGEESKRNGGGMKMEGMGDDVMGNGGGDLEGGA